MYTGLSGFQGLYREGVILISLPLYTTWPFICSSILSSFCIFSVLIIIWWGDFFMVESIWCSVCFLSIYRHLLLQVRRIFFYDLAENIFWAFEMGLFSFLCNYSWFWSLHGVPDFLDVCVMDLWDVKYSLTDASISFKIFSMAESLTSISCILLFVLEFVVPDS